MQERRLARFVSVLIILTAVVAWLGVVGTPLGAQEATPKAEKGKTPESWAIATADSVMKRYPDYRKAHPASYFPCPWTYVHGYHLIGFEKLYRSTGDKKYLDYIEKYIASFIDEKGNITGIDRGGKKINVDFNNLDNMLVGNCVLFLYETTKDERYKLAADKIRKAFDTYPRNSDGGFWHNLYFKGEMWIDGIFMGQMFLIRYGKTIGDSEYCFNEAAKQITLYAKRARKGDGLYLHALSERPVAWADPKTGLSSEVWSEGLGWYALILVETLDVLPKDHPKRDEVVDILRRLAVDLKKHQDPKSGRWFQVVDKGRPAGQLDRHLRQRHVRLLPAARRRAGPAEQGRLRPCDCEGLRRHRRQRQDQRPGSGGHLQRLRRPGCAAELCRLHQRPQVGQRPGSRRGFPLGHDDRREAQGSWTVILINLRRQGDKVKKVTNERNSRHIVTLSPCHLVILSSSPIFHIWHLFCTFTDCELPLT